MVAKVIAVMSPKGGVGKTTTSVNIAATLASLGKKTLIIDANLETPHVAIYFGFVGYKYSLEDVFNSSVPVEYAIYKTDVNNLHILPSRVFKGRGDGNARYKIINLFYQIQKVERNYDFIIIDSKPSYDVDFVKAIRGISAIIVSVPEITAMIEARKLNDELRSSGVNVLGLVMNRYDRRIRDRVGEREASEITGISNTWIVPEDKSLYSALKQGLPVVLWDRKLASSRAFFELAGSLVGE